MISLVDARSGREIPAVAGIWTVEETGRYLVAGVDRVTRDGVPLPQRDGRFALEVGFRVSRLVLDWNDGEQSGRVQVHVLPSPGKLAPEQWLAMIQDLESWLPSVTLGVDGARHGAVGLDGVTVGWIAEALLPLVPLLLRAVRDVSENLRIRVESELRNESIRRARRIPRETLHWMIRHPDTARWMDPWLSSELTGSPPVVPLRCSFDTLDHPANRYLHGLLRRVGSQLRAAARQLVQAPGDEDASTWCAGRAAGLLQAADQLDVLLRRSPLRELPQGPATETALATIVDEPRYARVHALARRFLSTRFEPETGETAASMRPSYGVYELWCFLAVERALHEALPAVRWMRRGFSSLLRLGHSGSGAVVTGEAGDGVVALQFNPTFVSFPHRRGSARWSVSGERRPDFVVSWKPHDGAPTWIVMDAKYRIGRQLIDAFQSLHAYRDALHWDAFGGRARSGVLLCPARTIDTEVWFEDTIRSEYGLGAFELRPEAPVLPLATWIVETLGISTSEPGAAQAPAIASRGQRRTSALP